MRKEKGITLVALIITIIIMLILVAVSVNILVKSNLIGVAEKTANGYKTATDEETNAGAVQINGKKYDSIDDYVNRKKLRLKYTEKDGEIRVYCQGDFYDYVTKKSTGEKEQGIAQAMGRTDINELIEKDYNNNRNAYEKAMVDIPINSGAEVNIWGYEDALNILCIAYIDSFVNEYKEEIARNPNDYPDFSNAQISLPNNKIEKGTFAVYNTETNGDYKFKVEGNGGQDELIVSINYPEKNIKIQIVEDKDIMTKISTQEELAAYLKQLPEQEPIQYTITSPRWTNIILNKTTMPDGRTFEECPKKVYKNQVLYDGSFLLYYLDENDNLVTVKTCDEIQTEHTYFGLYTLIKR